jgi:putative endonuclease
VIPITENWRGIAGELDLIALDKRTLIVVEVKTRHISLEEAHPAISAITQDKRERLERLGRSFIRNHGPFCRRYAIKTRRTDVIEVYYSRSRWGILTSHKIHWHKGVSL